MTGALAAIGVAVLQIVVAFYSFWIVWRVLMPILPGPAAASDRIAPFALYFTDPLVVPLGRLLRLPEGAISFALLVGVAALQVALSRFGGSL